MGRTAADGLPDMADCLCHGGNGVSALPWITGMGCDSLYGQFKPGPAPYGLPESGRPLVPYPVSSLPGCLPAVLKYIPRIKSSSSTVPMNQGDAPEAPLCFRVNSTISENANEHGPGPGLTSCHRHLFRTGGLPLPLLPGREPPSIPSPASPYPYGICTQGQAPELVLFPVCGP